MSGQRYAQPIALERMSHGLCPECGLTADLHDPSPQFWMRGNGCDLLPRGVTERVEQYRADLVADSTTETEGER